MAQAKKGDTVEVHYTGKLDDGAVFSTTANDEPVQFAIGEGRLIPGFEQSVVGMSPGESKTAKIPADEAYGPRHKQMVVVVNRSELPADMKVEMGQQLQINGEEGQTFEVTVIDVSESSVTLDGNHPLAGKDLIFDIQLTQIL